MLVLSQGRALGVVDCFGQPCRASAQKAVRFFDARSWKTKAYGPLASQSRAGFEGTCSRRFHRGPLALDL